MTGTPAVARLLYDIAKLKIERGDLDEAQTLLAQCRQIKRTHSFLTTHKSPKRWPNRSNCCKRKNRRTKKKSRPCKNALSKFGGTMTKRTVVKGQIFMNDEINDAINNENKRLVDRYTEIITIGRRVGA